MQDFFPAMPRHHSVTPLVACLVSLSLADAEEPLAQVLRTVSDPVSQQEVPFREVIRVATGRTVLPLDPREAAGSAILAAVSSALDATLTRLNRPDSPARTEPRINEVSVLFETALREFLDQLPEFDCSRPVTAAGKSQAAGYPDLRIRHLPTGRIAYLDPKLYAAGSRASSLRTFYFTPRQETNKVLDDAHHLLAGIEHRGSPGAWTFAGWNIVDLYQFHVRLKAEYQASNRDLYQEDLILRSSPCLSPDPPRASTPASAAAQ